MLIPGLLYNILEEGQSFCLCSTEVTFSSCVEQYARQKQAPPKIRCYNSRQLQPLVAKLGSSDIHRLTSGRPLTFVKPNFSLMCYVSPVRLLPYKDNAIRVVPGS